MNKELQNLISNVYGTQENEDQQQRYAGLISKFNQKFGERDYQLFSSPGRTEIGGNHTDHNHGKVLAASINLDSIAAAAANSDNEIILYSTGFEQPFIVNLNNLLPVSEEAGTTAGLVRGISAGFKNNGYNTGGFEAYLSSDVMIGSGLSSSASVEVLIGTILNHFYNEDSVPSEKIAIIGQYAENNFFGKPCGLMDQVACATGGIVTIDFFNPKEPKIESVNFDFMATGYRLIVVDTEANHADLTEDYASIPAEMKKVAGYFGKKFCSEISMEQMLPEIKQLRKKVSDRAILRAIHFLEENKRVDKQVEALKKNNFDEFLTLINESGNSSYKYLQNIFSPHSFEEQGVSLALALSDLFIKRIGRGACRVHGGGFAGTIQLFLPAEFIDEYTSYISQTFRKESVKVLSIRNTGAVCLENFLIKQ